MKTSISHIEKLVATINTVLKQDDTWTVETGFKAFCEQLEKFENVFFSFEGDEAFTHENCYDFHLEDCTESGYELDFSIFQAFSDIKSLSLEY